MKRRFVIAVDGLTAQNEKLLQDHLLQYGYWWHWISNLWLFVTRDEAVSATEISEKIVSLQDDHPRVFVMEIPEDVTWTTFGKKNKKGQDMSDWLKKTWVD
jgi:hypothetical protein